MNRTRVLLVTAPYYKDIVDLLVTGALRQLNRRHIVADFVEVAGALEIPVAIRIEHSSGKYDGYIALGCVIRGQTSHFEIVARESARGLMMAGMMDRLPVGNGILAVENREQAMERADPKRRDKGGEAAVACLSLIDMARRHKIE